MEWRIDRLLIKIGCDEINARDTGEKESTDRAFTATRKRSGTLIRVDKPIKQLSFIYS